MKRLALIGAAFVLSGCLPPVTADTVKTAWERCNGEGAAEYRVAQCSIVINFAETAPDRRAAALIERGKIRAEQSQFARAMADYGRALRINNRNAQVYAARALLHQARGAYDVALRDFDRALAIDPTLPAAITGRTETLANRVTQFEEDLASITEALQQTPTDSALLNQRCWIRTINNDDLDAALADCNAAILSQPTNAAALDSRGLVHLKRGDYAASIADYEAALAIEPTRGHYMFGRGAARIRMGLVAEGHADIAEAERLEPGITANYLSYGVAL
jgi:tetratricopeptide (TPR) repeat protein